MYKRQGIQAHEPFRVDSGNLHAAHGDAALLVVPEPVSYTHLTKTCAYTNHTILAEALEKWPRAYLDAVVPQLMPIIEKLDALARTRTKDESLAIIDKDDRVHMAHMDIHFTHSTNGVAYLHTEILKKMCIRDRC